MASFTLGSAPEQLKVILVAGADFVSSLRRKDDSAWPVGIEVILDFGATEWPATITGAIAEWIVDLADVDALLLTKPREVRLWYIEGGTRLLWAQGGIEARRGEAVTP